MAVPAQPMKVPSLPRQPSEHNNSRIKADNLSAILRSLRQQAGISRVHLAQRLGLSTATVTNLVGELIEQGLVLEAATPPSSQRKGAGRPQRALHLVADARYVLGIFVDVGQIHISLSNLLAQEVATLTYQHPLTKPAESVWKDLVDQVQRLLSYTAISADLLLGVGVAASGLVDPYTGVNIIAPNLQWRQVPIRAFLEEQLQLPVLVENNVRAMALGEAMFGVAQEVHALAFVYTRMGVGAGLVVGGRLYRGAAAGAGEIGHTTLLVEQHRATTLEALVSQPTILGLAREIIAAQPKGILAQHNQGGVHLDGIFAAARAGDSPTQTMLQSRARYMGIALANLVNVFNPELIVMGGILAQGQDILLPTIAQTMRQHAFAHLGEQVALQTTRFGADVGRIGAAALALDEFFYHQQSNFNLSERRPL